MNWQTDPFSQGAYSYATVESGEAKKILSKPVEDTLFFAGEALSEGAAMGAVEEALANGMKTARELLASCLSLLRSAYEYERGKIKTVRTAPPIANLTEHIAKLSEADWLHLAERLREKKLIAQKSKHEPDSLDCHPLIREHFSDKLRKDNPDAWKEAHNSLYEYYKIQAKERPDTIEEMMTPSG